MLVLKALSGTRKLVININTQGTHSRHCPGTCLEPSALAALVPQARHSQVTFGKTLPYTN